MIANQSGQSVFVEMVSAATGGAFVGTVTAYVNVNGQGQALGQTGSGICTAQGNGSYLYQPTAQETNGAVIAFTFIGTGAIPVTVQIATVTPSQQSALSTATGGLSTPVATLLADAFREIAVFAPNATIPPDDFNFALGKLNRLFDNMSNDRRLTYSQTFTQFTLVPNLQNPTIGPNSATFTTTTRPIEIRQAQVILTDVTPNVIIPINVRDYEWWASVPVRNIATTFPTDLYYEPDWPNGVIFLWPIPTLAYTLELVSRVSFGQVGSADTFWLPPGYRDYVTLALALALAQAYPGAFVSPLLQHAVAEHEMRLFNTNRQPARLATRDAGIPGGGTRGASFNYRDRQWHS